MLRPLSSAIAGVLTALVLASPAPVHAYGHADKVPISDVRRAHLFYRSPGSRPDPVLAENVLRVFALRESDPLVDRNLAWVRQSGWQPEFKAIFERAVIWARTTRRKRPDELYRLSHELRTRRNAGEKFFGSVANELRAIAAKRGHKQAIREKDEWHRDRRRQRSRSDHARLVNEGRKGDPVTMDLLAGHYRHAEGAEKDLAKAYYWMLRAKQGGRDVAFAMDNLERRIRRADRDRALKWLADGTVPAF